MLSSCGGKNVSLEKESFKELYRPEYAGGFLIKQEDGKESVLIESYNPWQGAENDTRKLFIQRNNENVPEGYDGIVLNGNARRVICMSSGHMAMIERLGMSDRIVGGSSLDYVTSQKLKSRRNQLAEIGYEGAYNYESLIASKPDLVIIYGVNGVSPIEPKLKDLGIPYIYVGDYLEESPLGKAEWIVAIGECLGIRGQAVAEFKSIKSKYEIEKKRLEDADVNLKKPKVMLNAPYGGSWFMPPRGSYMARLIQDAEGEYLYKGEGNSSTAISDEESTIMLHQADVWLNPGRAYKDLNSLKREVKNGAEIECIKNGMVYDNTLRCSENGGNDFYESGIVNPDLILRDLIKIFHPELVDEEMVYYRRIEE